jgi:pSer/pThr/pTyr-binding forkhead associated (FHA) protein
VNATDDSHGGRPGPAEPRNLADTTAHYGLLDGVPIVGEPRTSVSAEAAAAVEALPPTSALLIVQHGPNAGARFLLDGPRTTAGRSPGADIFLDDVTVSRKHAEFLGDGDFSVRDVGSLNGTYLNRVRIDETVPLRDGDEVQIGKYRLTYHPSPNRPAQPPAGSGS